MIAHRRRVFVAALVIVAAQAATWWLVGQRRLVLSVPEMAHQDFSLYEAHERKYHLPVNQPMQLMICDQARELLGGAGVKRVASALVRFNLNVMDKESPGRDAVRLCYEVRWQSP